MAAFHLPSLNTARNEIRLFLIKAAVNEDDVIELVISTHSLDDSPSYIALSYTWGDPTDQQNIEAHGSHLSIPRNLYAFLQQLSLLIGDINQIHLWADAICIRQDDLAEKSRQIPLMGRIFNAAIGVNVWLGPASNDSDLAINLMRTWSSARDEDGKIDLPQFLSSSSDAFAVEAWVALSNLLLRAWWTRMWTYQEAVLARNLVFTCGQSMIDIHSFIGVAATWGLLLMSPSKFGLTDVQSYILRSVPLYNMIVISGYLDGRVSLQDADESVAKTQRMRFNVHELQVRLHSREATDDHDKLYAVLGVVENLGFEMIPNYTKSITEVYTEFVAKHVMTNLSLDMVSLSGIGVLNDNPSTTLALPSWVPDMRSCSRWPDSIQDTHSGIHEQLRPIIDVDLRGGILHATGVECDIVSTTLVPADEDYDFMKLLLLQNKATHPTGTNWLQVLFRTVTADISDSRNPGFFRDETDAEHFWGSLPGFLDSVSIQLQERPSIRHFLLSTLFGANQLKLDRQSNEDEFEIRLLDFFTGEHGPSLDSESARIYLNLAPETKEVSLRLFAQRYKSHTVYRKFFTTQNGYIGLGPEGMQAEDRLCFIFGGDMPCLLRPIGDSFAHVGSCYVYGLMGGEIIELVNDGKFEQQSFSIK